MRFKGDMYFRWVIFLSCIVGSFLISGCSGGGSGGGNRLPEVSGNQGVSLNEDSVTVVGIEATDPDGDLLTFEIVQLPENISIEHQGQVLTVRPAENWHGTSMLQFTVSDGNLVTDPIDFTIIVLPVNDVPAVPENQSATGIEDRSFSVRLEATDVDGDDLVFTLASLPEFIDVQQTSADLLLTPTANWSGTDSLCVASFEN